MGSKALCSSSTILPAGGEYEVFLSFRGPDTRYTFTDFLYTNLDSVGVHTFRDDNELRKGEEIGPELLKAIRESKISIPVFSKNYASSKWCLLELAQMVECRRTTGQLILPIFFDVEPSEVRHQSGIYEEAFRKHESCFHEINVKEWKEALREVGALKGWEVKKQADGYQGKLIKDIIVPIVLLELKKNYMVVTENLVGIDHHVNEMMILLNLVSSAVQIVGIHGMGGIGKTTIAKFIYNKLLQNFECCSFLPNVRETVQQDRSLVSLQKQLLNDTLKSCPEITSVDSGIDMIKHRFLKKNVLIVLDDVNERSQFDWLVGKREWFGPRSRIIVITRDKHVLNLLQVDGIYEPRLMNSKESLQLFSIHAFRKKFPPKDYEKISEEVASTAAGLPLALEIIGSFLSDKEKVVWEDTLKKLKKIPNDQVEKKLKISYEALNYEQQQIFLDIACFSDEMNNRGAFYMWNDLGYHPEKEINVLCLMSLIKMEDDDQLKMHDQLRDLGREIVRQENFKDPGKRSRLWDHEEALDILEEWRGTDMVEALSLHFKLGSQVKPCFTNEEFAKLVNLKYLRVDCADLVGDFKHILSRLRWLRWHHCPQHFKATNFHMKNLVILDLSESMITEDWEGWKYIKNAKKLKVLKLSFCALRRTPEFSTYATLETLNLGLCESLVEIDLSIGNLKNLKVLIISGTKIAKMPDEIWMLEKLEVINASYCYYLEGDIPSNITRLSSLRFLGFFGTKIRSLPTSIWELSCIKTLELGACTELQLLPKLPPSLKSLNVSCIPHLANLVNLEELHLRGCQEVPSDIWKLSKLQILTLKSSKMRILPKEIGLLSKLKVLDVQLCDDLQSILGLPSSLVGLSLEFCSSLERLPNLSNLRNLLKLSFLYCNKLTEFQGIGELESLTSLQISVNDKLVILDLHEQLASLPSLEMSECKCFEEKSDLSNLKQLKRIIIIFCQELIEIQGLDKVKSLEYLYLNDCISLARIPNLSNLKMLRCLQLARCENLHEIEGLEALESLEDLIVSGCSSLKKFACHPNTFIKESDSEDELTA